MVAADKNDHARYRTLPYCKSRFSSSSHRIEEPAYRHACLSFGLHEPGQRANGSFITFAAPYLWCESLCYMRAVLERISVTNTVPSKPPSLPNTIRYRPAWTLSPCILTRLCYRTLQSPHGQSPYQHIPSYILHETLEHFCVALRTDNAPVHQLLLRYLLINCGSSWCFPTASVKRASRPKVL